MNSFYRLSRKNVFSKYFKLSFTNFSNYSTLGKKVVEKYAKNIPIFQISISLFPIAYCSTSKEKIKFKTDENLTNEYLIKQSCTLSIEACTQLLTHTTNALLEYNHKFKKNTEKLISLLEFIIENNGQSCEEIDLEIIEKRSSIREDLNSIQQLEGLLEYVEKMSTDAAEVAFLAGSEFMSTAMCERLNWALRQLENEKLNRKNLESLLLETNEKLVKCSNNNK